MSEKRTLHKVTIAVTPSTAAIEVAPVDPAQTAYVEKFLTRKGCASCKTYVYPEVHSIVSRLVKASSDSGATIGGFISEVLLDHFQKNRELMQAIFDDNKMSLFE